MLSMIEFFQTDPGIGLLVAFVIFLITIFLVIKQIVRLRVAAILLIFAILTGMIITNQKSIHHYFNPSFKWENPNVYDNPNDLPQQIKNSVKNLEREMLIEKENVKQVMSQIQEIFTILESEKQKLQTFIEETKEQFISERQSENSDQKDTIPALEHFY